jgi:hypothetical protein
VGGGVGGGGYKRHEATAPSLCRVAVMPYVEVRVRAFGGLGGGGVSLGVEGFFGGGSGVAGGRWGGAGGEVKLEKRWSRRQGFTAA